MWPFSSRKNNVYLDYAAATPVRAEVLKVMNPLWAEDFGNASSIHDYGVKAKKALSAAREEAARTLRVRADDIVFTSGGTESNNLAILGSVKAMIASGVAPSDIEIISTAAEHPSVLKSLEEATKQGARVTLAPLDMDGRVIAEEFKKLLSPQTRLVSLAYANSETGVVEDIGKLARIVRAFEKENGLTVLIHTDACQAPLWLPCGLDSLSVDLMSLDAGKCRGPKGVGLLVKRPRVKLAAVAYGGSQENDLRPGTEPLPLIVGAARALSLAQSEYEKLSAAVRPVRDYFISQLLTVPGVVINGSKEHRLANNINISIPGQDTEFLVVALSAAGIFASTRSACSGAGAGVSKVVLNMTKDRERAMATVRFTLSPETTYKDAAYVVKAINDHLRHSRLPD